MDMSGMDMSDMGGMDSSTSGMFSIENMGLAQTFWYIIAGTVGFFMLLRIWRFVAARLRYVLHSC